jgi:hypothetical protein
LGGDNGLVWTFNQSNNEQFYYQLSRTHGDVDQEPNPLLNVTSIALAGNEDCLYYVNANNQLEKMTISFDGPSNEPLALPESVHSAFHQTGITGMDVCLRK